MNLKDMERDLEKICLELLEAANLNPKDAVVIGGSTSEVVGEAIGSSTNLEVAKKIIQTIVPILKKNDIYPIIQSCEHINRVLVVEREYAAAHGLDPVNVVPIATAGGGFATTAMEILDDPVIVEHVGAQAGIDIGDVFIGMHIKGVGVVVRSEIKNRASKFDYDKNQTEISRWR